MSFKLFKKQNNGSRGFTLVELLVSVSLFTIVMTIGLSVILSIIDGNKKTQAINSVVNNLNSSIDSMVRDMKTGIEYRCNQDDNDHLPINKGESSFCTSAGDSYPSVSFISTITGRERDVMYEFVPANAITGVGGHITKTTCDRPLIGTCSDAVRITSPEINVTDMRMYVKAGLNGVFQPGILLVIGGTAQINPTTISNFYLQTFVSRRVLNI